MTTAVGISLIVHAAAMLLSVLFALGDVSIEFNGEDIFQGNGAAICWLFAALHAGVVVALVESRS